MSFARVSVFDLGRAGHPGRSPWTRSVGRRAMASRCSGFSLVELLVAVAIGLVLTLAVTIVLMRNERYGRATTSINDIDQSATYAMFLLDQSLRSAGSGFASRAAETVGCRLNVTRGGVAALPRSAAWPAPFAAFTQSPRAAPVLIAKDQPAAGSDVIAVMSGSAGEGEAPAEVLALGPPLGLRNTLGLRANDLLLLADGQNDCLVLQAGTPNASAGTVPLVGDGSFHTILGTHRSLVDFGTPTTATVLVNLGNAGAAGAVAPNPPRFTLYGVGANRTLFSMDMLGLEAVGPQAIAEGVVSLRAVYGIDTNGDGSLDNWVDPGTSPWTAADLLAGTATSRTQLAQIVALRVGMVLRTSRVEREVVAPASVTMFADLAGLEQTHTIATAEQNYRHRVYEQTVPLRNVLLSRQP